MAETNAQSSMVHEAEAQRQHVRVTLPSHLVIGNHQFHVSDWSVYGLAFMLNEAQQKSFQFKSGEKYKAQMSFPMEGYEVTLAIAIRVVYFEKETQRVGVNYDDLSMAQLSLLQMLLSRYVSGELVSAGDMIAVASRDGSAQPRKEIPDPMEGMDEKQKRRYGRKRLVKTAAVFALALGLLAYVCLSFYEMFFMVHTQHAQIVADKIILSAPKSGRIYYENFTPDTVVSPGAPLLTIISDTDTSFTVESPCECIVKERLQANNQWAVSGSAVLDMVNVQSTPYVEAYVSSDEALKLSKGMEVWISYPGDPVAKKGQIIGIDADIAWVEARAKLTIAPLEAVSVDMVGDPVAVRIHL